MPPLSYSRSSVYTDNQKHFMKSCLNVFPVVSTCMIFFGLNSFSSLVSPEFSVTLCLQGTITSFFSALEKPKRAKPLPFPPTSIPPFVLCSSSVFHEWGCHQRAQCSIQGLIMVFYKTAWMLLSLHWEQVIRDILSLHLPFMVGSHWWQYLSWLAQWPSAFYPFPFPADKFPVFSANSRHESKWSCSPFRWSLSHCLLLWDSCFFCLMSSSSAILMMPPIFMSPANFKRTLLLLALRIIHEPLSQLNISILLMFFHVSW